MSDKFTAFQRERLWRFATGRPVLHTMRDDGSELLTFTQSEAEALWISILRDGMIRSQSADLIDDYRERLAKIASLALDSEVDA